MQKPQNLGLIYVHVDVTVCISICTIAWSSALTHVLTLLFCLAIFVRGNLASMLQHGRNWSAAFEFLLDFVPFHTFVGGCIS